jgi:hypothetical protein
MNLVDRAKNILITPKTEWEVIKNESSSVQQIITGYVLPLSLIPTLAIILGWGLVGIVVTSFTYGIALGLVVFINAIIGVILSSLIVDALAPSFGSQKDLVKSTQLVAFSMTPGWIAGILSILPAIGWIGSLASLYGLYILYLGLAPMKGTPEDKKVGYLIVSILVIILLYFVVSAILTAILLAVFGVSMMYGVGM